MSLQGPRFLLGIFAGVVLAAAVVAASSAGGTGTGLPFLQPGGSSGALYVVSSTTTAAASSTTTAVSTATMSSTTTASGAPPTAALSTGVNSTASRTTSWQAFTNQASAASAQPSMVAGLLRSSALAIPVLAGLLLGLLVYRVTAKGRLD